ncbi:MAG: ABC transporter permease [Candidatus Bipolaricaulia bacterium]
MQIYALRRLLLLIPVLFVVSVIVFSIVHLIPGDPATVLLGTEAADPELLERLKQSLGLDKPLHVQYLLWLGRVFRGDLGSSVRTGEPVVKLILQRFPFTLELAVYALFLTLIIAIPLGTIAATSLSRIIDLSFQSIALFGLSIPTFWSGTMFILLFSVYLGWFPIINFPSFIEAPFSNLWGFFLPAITLAIPSAASIARMVRASVLEVSRQEYITTARSKGLPETVVVFKHMLKNAMIPIITLIGIIAGYLLGGAIVVEQVFAIPGLGRLGVDSIVQRDYPLLQAVVLVVTMSFVMVNLIVDLVYVFLNPKIRYE